MEDVGCASIGPLPNAQNGEIFEYPTKLQDKVAAIRSTSVHLSFSHHSLLLPVMSVPERFKGYGSFSKDEPTALKLFEFTPKKFEDHDVDIKITHCGVCSD
jgi:hypothetical protein